MQLCRGAPLLLDSTLMMPDGQEFNSNDPYLLTFGNYLVVYRKFRYCVRLTWKTPSPTIGWNVKWKQKYWSHVTTCRGKWQLILVGINRLPCDCDLDIVLCRWRTMDMFLVRVLIFIYERLMAACTKGYCSANWFIALARANCLGKFIPDMV